MENETDYRNGRARRVDYIRPAEADKVDPNLTLEECVERRAVASETLSEITNSKDSIRSQLASAHATQKVTGIAPNPIWQARANGAMRYYSRQYKDHQRAIENLSRRIREIRCEFPGGIDREFVRHARTLLPPEIYGEIWAKVDAELPGAERAV
jgi:hypothetical protein